MKKAFIITGIVGLVACLLLASNALSRSEAYKENIYDKVNLSRPTVY